MANAVYAALRNVEKHAVAESTNLMATHWGKHIRNLRVPDAFDTLDNGVIVARGKYADDPDDDVYPMDFAGAKFKGIIEGQDRLKESPAANLGWVICCEEVEDGKSYLVLQTPFGYLEQPSTARDEAYFYNVKGDVVRAYQLAYDDRFTISDEGFTVAPTVADIGKEVTVDTTTGKLVIS